MLISIHGTDRGNAMLRVLVFMFVLSMIFVSFSARISALEQLAAEKNHRVLLDIELANKQIMKEITSQYEPD